MQNKAQLINAVIAHKGYTSYCELGLGVARETYDNIICDYKMGIDDNPHTRPDFQGTTDAFFEKSSTGFDVFFIDAWHEDAQVVKDFDNCIYNLRLDGVIFMHDVGPALEKDTALTASGTAYKSFINIRNSSKYDAFCYQFPDGDVLGIVKLRENSNPLLIKRDIPITFELYNSERETILQKKTLEEVLSLV